MKKELNTALRITLKDQTFTEYASIEEASEKTGITIAALKIRANKSGSMKDGITYEWIDSHTKKHYQAKKSKAKGSNFEYEVVQHLKEIGYTGCCSSRGESKKVDNNKIDIIDTDHLLPCNIQCKHTMNLPNYFDIRDACSDKTKPFCLAWKKSPAEGSVSRGTVVILPIEYFYNLIKK